MKNDLISRSALHAAICLNAKYGTYGEFTDGSEVCFTSKEVHAGKRRVEYTITTETLTMDEHIRFEDLERRADHGH